MSGIFFILVVQSGICCLFMNHYSYSNVFNQIIIWKIGVYMYHKVMVIISINQIQNLGMDVRA